MPISFYNYYYGYLSIPIQCPSYVHIVRTISSGLCLLSLSRHQTESEGELHNHMGNLLGWLEIWFKVIKAMFK